VFVAWKKACRDLLVQINNLLIFILKTFIHKFRKWESFNYLNSSEHPKMIKMMIQRDYLAQPGPMGFNGWSFHIKFTVKQRHESHPYLQVWGLDPNLATSRVVRTAGVLKDPSCLGENCKSAFSLLKKAENTSQPPLNNVYTYHTM